MRTLLARGLAVLVATLAVVACQDKGPSLQQLRKDGYGCTKAGNKGGFVVQPGEHCFVCPDDISLGKCTTNPIAAGCHEGTAKDCSS